MKNNLQLFLTLAALIFVLAADNFAQAKTGGYKKLAVTDVGVVAAADFAARMQGEKDSAEITLQSVEKAERQTVAGTNYKLCVEVFRIEAGDDVEVRQLIQIVVFRNLKKQFTLKSWEETADCGE